MYAEINQPARESDVPSSFASVGKSGATTRASRFTMNTAAPSARSKRRCAGSSAGSSATTAVTTSGLPSACAPARRQSRNGGDLFRVEILPDQPLRSLAAGAAEDTRRRHDQVDSKIVRGLRQWLFQHLHVVHRGRDRGPLRHQTELR